MHSYESPLTPLFQRGEKGLFPFEKGGLRGIINLAIQKNYLKRFLSSFKNSFMSLNYLSPSPTDLRPYGSSIFPLSSLETVS
jgi:hypothetical protein